MRIRFTLDVELSRDYDRDAVAAQRDGDSTTLTERAPEEFLYEDRTPFSRPAGFRL